MTQPPKPRRPSYQPPVALEALGGRSDPVAALHAAHETAAALVRAGHSANDPEVTARLVAVSDEVGLETLADLWAARPARSLPGALFRLYLLREWVRTDPDGAAREYAAGIGFTEPDHVVAGVDPPEPAEIQRVGDEILRGVFTGDLAVALERAAAFCRVVSSGRGQVGVGMAELRRAGRLQDMAADLAASAQLWRTGRLQ